MPSAGVKCGVNKAALVCCEFYLLRPRGMWIMQDSCLISVYDMLSYVNMYLYTTVLKLVLS